jgi:hypothetical protein
MPSLEYQIRQVIEKNLLQSIDFKVTPEKVIARAIPLTVHPMVEERRTASFKERNGEALTLAEVMQITEDAHKPLATGIAKTFDIALVRMIEGLGKDKDGKGNAGTAQER